MRNKRYDRSMISNSSLTLLYWILAIFGLVTAWLFGAIGEFSRLETPISLLVGLFGLFIALWITNRERNIRITENHFYKLSVLWHVFRILDGFVVFFRNEYCNYFALDETAQKAKKEEMRNRVREELFVFDRHKAQIEASNINMHVPADIRYAISQFAQKGSIPILFWRYNEPQLSDNVETVKRKLLEPLHKAIDDEYFTKDYDFDVKERLSSVNHMKEEIEKCVEEWSKSKQMGGFSA